MTAATVAGCSDAIGPYRDAATTNDIAVGALTYPGARAMASTTPERFFGGGPPAAEPGWVFYKIGPVVERNAVVTVAIGEAARSWAALVAPSNPSSRATAVTYEACAAARTAWPGGFAIRNDHRRSCLPLDVYSSSSAQPQRVVLPLFRGTC